MEMDFTKVKLNKEQQDNAFLIGSKAQEVGIDPDLALAFAWRENQFQTKGKSPKGATGVMQVMPANAKAYGYAPEDLLDAIRILNSSIILKAMSKLIEIDKLIPDPYFTGGGLNVTVSGGLLDVHVDGNYHDATGLNRRINAIIYLNPGWQNTWGGEFGIYNSTGDILIKKVEPLFNRLVILDTND
jgi:hypothetical protein